MDMDKILGNLQDAVRTLVGIIKDAVAKLTWFVDQFKNTIKPDAEEIRDDQYNG